MKKTNKAEGILFVSEDERKFIEYFNENWAKFSDDARLSQSQINFGNRLRPRLVYWSFTMKKEELSEEEFKTAASLAACMELIHKSTILLDDWIDQDDARHGQPSFHVQYSPELAVMYALNILSKSITELNNIFYHFTDEKIYHTCIQNISETMQRMTLGEIQELTLTSEELFDFEKIKEIIQLETAELLTNSLLMGYYGSGGNNLNVAQELKNIGYDCGYIFQCMNDLEPFCEKNINEQHKGYFNLDYDRERKNIGIALLHKVSNKADRSILVQKPPYDELIHLFRKYNIIEFFLKDLDDLNQKNLCRIQALSELGISKTWCGNFAEFISNVIAVCVSRLGLE